MNGGIAGGIGVIATVGVLYAIIIWQQKRALTTSLKNSIPLSSSFSVTNPLKVHQQRPRPLKSSKKSAGGKR